LVLLAAAAGAGGLALVGVGQSRGIPNLHIRLGEEKCKRCGMIISRINYAAAIYSEGNDGWQKYDDVGCMINDYKVSTNVLAVKVFDFATGEEVTAKEAYYALANLRKLRTPMGYNIIAFRGKSAAEAQAREHDSPVLGWDQALRSVPGGL